MAEQERKTRPTRAAGQQEEVKPNPEMVQKGKELKEHLDRVMDEVDDVRIRAFIEG